MRRLSPVVLVGALVAIALAVWRGSDKPSEPDSNWRPVEPS